MADDLKNRGLQDRSRINELEAAGKAAEVIAQAVRDHWKKK